MQSVDMAVCSRVIAGCPAVGRASGGPLPRLELTQHGAGETQGQGGWRYLRQTQPGPCGEPQGRVGSLELRAAGVSVAALRSQAGDAEAQKGRGLTWGHRCRSWEDCQELSSPLLPPHGGSGLGSPHDFSNEETGQNENR